LPWILSLSQDLLSALSTDARYAFVAIHRVARKALCPEPVVGFFGCYLNQLVPIEEVTADLLHVLVRRNKNKIARIEMTFQTQCVICFEVFITDNLVMAFTPIKKPLVTYGLTFGAFTLVIWINKFSKVLTVRKVQKNSICVEPFLEVIDLRREDLSNLFKVAGNGDQIITPVKLRFINLTAAIGKEVSINTKLWFNDSRPTLPLLLPLRRGGL
jgi:hypothetical protein